MDSEPPSIKREEEKQVNENPMNTMASSRAVGEEAAEEVRGCGDMWGGEDPTDLLSIEEDLLFGDDTFPSLPDFLSSQSSSSSASSPPNLSAPLLPSSSSSSSSSAASCAMVKMETTEDGAFPAPPPPLSSDLQPMETESMDILAQDMELFDPDDLWDPLSLFPEDDEDDNSNPTTLREEPKLPQLQEQQHRQGVQEVGNGENQRQQQQRMRLGGACDDLAMVFLEWLKNNKESISPEDLRSIKLKKSTIECAARRLGGGREGMLQLLKLILTWVQNYHLQRKCREISHHHQDVEDHQFVVSNYQYQPQQPYQAFGNPDLVVNHDPSNMNGLHNYNTLNWVPDPGSVAVHPNYAVYPNLQQTTSVNLPPPPEYQAFDLTQNSWSSLSSFSNPQMQPPPFNGGVGNPHVGQMLYHQQEPSQVVKTASATKEARKKRMARQRRFSSFHRNHNHQHHDQQQQHKQQQQLDQHLKLVNASTRSDPGNWMFWSPSPPTCSPIDVGQKPQQNRPQQQQKQQHEQKEAEMHLPELEARDGISIPMEDIGTSRIWNMRYRHAYQDFFFLLLTISYNLQMCLVFWPNNKSRMYLLENTGDFVRLNGLQEGDFIIIYSDLKCGKYMIRGVKVGQSETKGEGKGKGRAQNNSISDTGDLGSYVEKMGNDVINGVQISPAELCGDE
ncbi:Regulatory protein viviparous-1 [Acorus calamus]|uniref:Regulatory protein viviparous-1 n=1 Tax=Acorus calamus TaxID=4465 RepID=A0AAV9CZP5_ACOCL|nr:Regulatory protein viviparous-1 [Acorus calamus]